MPPKPDLVITETKENTSNKSTTGEVKVTEFKPKFVNELIIEK